MKFGCSFGIFLNSAHLICRSMDISKCFNGSLRLRDNESRLYIRKFKDTLTDDLVRVNNALKYWPCIINEGVDTRLIHRYDDVLLLSKL